MVEAFIRERGVTVCPSFGTPELAAIHIKREQEGTGWRAVHLRKLKKAGRA